MSLLTIVHTSPSGWSAVAGLKEKNKKNKQEVNYVSNTVKS